jgi:hypothetical protein
MKGTREADFIVANYSIVATRRDTSFAATQAVHDSPEVNRPYRTKKGRSSYSTFIR